MQDTLLHPPEKVAITVQTLILNASIAPNQAAHTVLLPSA